MVPPRPEGPRPPGGSRRHEADEIVRIVTASVRECWQAYTLQFEGGGRPDADAMDAILARSVYPIVAFLEAAPAESRALRERQVVRAMLTAFLEMAQQEIAREHGRMLRTFEREAERFAARAARAMARARRQATPE